PSLNFSAVDRGWVHHFVYLAERPLIQQVAIEPGQPLGLSAGRLQPDIGGRLFRAASVGDAAVSGYRVVTAAVGPTDGRAAETVDDGLVLTIEIDPTDLAPAAI